MDNDKLAYLVGAITKSDTGVTVIASDETTDRSGESIPAASWDLGNFRKSPRLLVDHDYRVESIVGRAEDVRVEGGKLLFRPVFHELTELAKTVKEMVMGGILDTVSVGFLRKTSDEATLNELMEISFVAVPANPNARVLSVKSIDQETAKAVEGFAEGEPTPEAPAEPEPTEPLETDQKPTDNASPEAQNEPINDSAPENDPTPIEAPEVQPEAIPAEPEPATEEAKTVQPTEHKSGRVLSEKNRGIIQESLAALSAATVALNDLLGMSEPSQGNEKSATATAEERSNSQDLTADLETYIEKRKIIRGVATSLSEALSKLRFER